MDNLIWFNLPMLSNYDSSLLDPGYKNSKWFTLPGTFSPLRHLHSRTRKLETPWDLSQRVCPIPPVIGSDTDFTRVMDSTATRVAGKIVADDKIPYFAWSGGIDSTCALVALLKTGNQNFLNRLIIMCNQHSVMENSYFYHQYIKGKFPIVDIDHNIATEYTYDKIVFLDGHVGDHIFGGSNKILAKMLAKKEIDRLSLKWRNTDIYKLCHEIYPGSPKDIDVLTELTIDSIKHSPVDIVTVHDFIWWARFDMHVQDVLMMHVIPKVAHLTPQQSQVFYNNSVRIFAEPEMQVWSMISLEQRQSQLLLDPKYSPKKYIYDFDKNDLYFAHKTKQTSSVKSSEDARWATLVAIDSSWNKYHITDVSVRQKLGKILGR